MKYSRTGLSAYIPLHALLLQDSSYHSCYMLLVLMFWLISACTHWKRDDILTTFNYRNSIFSLSNNINFSFSFILFLLLFITPVVSNVILKFFFKCHGYDTKLHLMVRLQSYSLWNRKFFITITVIWNYTTATNCMYGVRILESFLRELLMLNRNTVNHLTGCKNERWFV